jgi:hypothetical protein
MRTIDMTRGVPSPEQLNLSDAMRYIPDTHCKETGIDCGATADGRLSGYAIRKHVGTWTIVAHNYGQHSHTALSAWDVWA